MQKTVVVLSDDRGWKRDTESWLASYAVPLVARGLADVALVRASNPWNVRKLVNRAHRAARAVILVGEDLEWPCSIVRVLDAIKRARRAA